MPQATDGGDDTKYAPCECNDPAPGPEDDLRRCANCGDYITGAIIGGEVHSGYTRLGNGQAFFKAKERWSLDSGSRGTINTHDEGEWFRAFADAEAVPPHDHWKAQRLGVEALSFDHVVHADGEVEIIIQNRRIEDLPDGPKFPVQTGDIPDPRVD